MNYKLYAIVSLVSNDIQVHTSQNMANQPTACIFPRKDIALHALHNSGAFEKPWLYTVKKIDMEWL